MNRKSYIKMALSLIMLLTLTLLPVSAFAAQYPISVTLPVSVMQLGSVSEEEFRFLLTPLDGAPMPEEGQEQCEITRTGEGEISFPAISFRAAGVYNYTITQLKGSTPNAHYDSSVFDVTVTVTNSEDYRGLKAAIAIRCYDEKYEKAQFVTQYRATAAKQSISVRKVWEDYGKNRPDSITVKLKSEGQVLGTAVLNEQNGWAYSFEGLVKSGQSWYVLEDPVPYRYTVSYGYSDNTAIITNKLTTGLIQTGQRIVPIWILGSAGIVCVLMGIKGFKKKDE